jgi:hypothetical protein
MPRLPHSLLLRARNISPLLPLLLHTCRTLSSARDELRWLREHALAIAGARRNHPREVGALLLQLCRQRSRGVPLQYLLGSQPFGELDILCRPGVLIPRSVAFNNGETSINIEVGLRQRRILLTLPWFCFYRTRCLVARMD